MISALVISSSSPAAPALPDDLASAGIHVVGAVQRDQLVREAVRLAPDVVVCFDAAPGDALFDLAASLASTTPRAMVVFTPDGDAAKIERAVASGIHAYVVDGYAATRLRPLIHLALARFRHEQRLKDGLEDIAHRFEERKLVDRAKGILMRARQIPEDQAFKVLRTASMHANQRVGEISRQVIAAANEAEAVNRSGQLRMLSQRLVKLHAQAALGVEPGRSRQLLLESVARADENLQTLARILSRPTFGDLLESVLEPWSTLKAALAAPFDAARLPDIDRLAERLLLQADQLTGNLETTGLATSLQVINVSGRQRMLSQRLAKQALLGALLPREAAAAVRAEMSMTHASFERALEHLRSIPLSTPDIRRSLAGAVQAWAAMNGALPRMHTTAGQAEIAQASETLLALFEQLTGQYERSMQVLMG